MESGLGGDQFSDSSVELNDVPVRNRGELLGTEGVSLFKEKQGMNDQE